MLSYLAAIGFTLALWWFSTVAILYLDRRATHTFASSMAGGTLVLAVAIWAVMQTRGDATLAGAYVGFACGIAIWGWQLLSFYLGYIAGPRRHACEHDLAGWERFREGVKTSLYHECVVLAFGALLLALTWEAPNKSAFWTYLVLYWMHQSAKLNLFFGTPNHGEALLPADLRFLASFMKRRPMNLFFPVSVSLSIVVTVVLAQTALASEAASFDAVVFTMLASLMALAVLEHWLLVVPLPVDAMWQWGMGQAAPAASLSRNKDSGEFRGYEGACAPEQSFASDFASDYEHPPKSLAIRPYSGRDAPKPTPPRREPMGLLTFPEAETQTFNKTRSSDAF